MAEQGGGDQLRLAGEDPVALEAGAAPWKVMIVDDEKEVHEVTHLALDEYRFDDRPLEFISAYSGAEAMELCGQHDDIAVMLLDVVMETDDAGLNVAQFVRGALDNHVVRIILRTGQPGVTPERRVLELYDINDYRAKTELTQARLYTVMHNALATYRDMNLLAREGEELARARQRLDEIQSLLVDRFAPQLQALQQGVRELADNSEGGEALLRQAQQLEEVRLECVSCCEKGFDE